MESGTAVRDESPISNQVKSFGLNEIGGGSVELSNKISISCVRLSGDLSRRFWQLILKRGIATEHAQCVGHGGEGITYSALLVTIEEAASTANQIISRNTSLNDTDDIVTLLKADFSFCLSKFIIFEIRMQILK